MTGSIRTLGRLAWQAYVTDGVPSSGAKNPAKTEIVDFVDAIDKEIGVTVWASGATGDGVTDDTAAIQAAVTLAEALVTGTRYGAKVMLGSGNFLTTTTITINTDGIHIQGDHATSTFVVNSTNNDVFAFTKGGSLLQQVGLHNLRIYGAAAAPTAGARVRLVNVAGGTFENLHLEHGYQGIVIEGGLGSSFVNVTTLAGVYWSSLRTGSSGLYLKALSGATPAGNEFVNCNFQSSGGNAYLADGIVIEAADGAFFSNCHFGFAGGAAARFKQTAGTDQVTGLTFHGCYFDGYFGANGANAVVIENPNGSTGAFGLMAFTGCYFLGDYTDAGFRVKSDATNFHGATFAGCHFGGATASALLRLSAGTRYAFAGNHYYDGPASGPAILIDGATADISIVGNTFGNLSGTMSKGVSITGTADHIAIAANNFGALTTPFESTSSGTDIAFSDDNVPAPAWSTYTPTVSPSAGSITTVSGAAGRYRKIGKTVHVTASFTITTNGTGSGLLRCTLPFTAKSNADFSGSGKETAVTGMMLSAYVNQFVASTYMLVGAYTDGSYPGGDGRYFVVSLTYEAA